MSGGSDVLVRLRLLGAQIMARDAAKAGGALGKVERGGRGAGRGLQEFGRSAEAATGKLRVLGTVAAGGVVAGLAAAGKQSVTFEQGMANVQAKLLTTNANMDKLRGVAVDLGAKTQFSAGQAADAMGELAAQGFGVKQIMGVLPGTLNLAAASGVDLAQAAQIQTETLHGFGLAAGQAGRVADVLAQTANRSAAGIDDMQESLSYIAPVAKASGQSLEDMFASVGLLSNVGIKGSQAGTTLRTAMVRLSSPTDGARDALARLGLKAGDLAGPKGLLSLPNIMRKFVVGAKGVSKNTRNAALAAIFGREALSGMVALVEAGPKKFDRMAGALQRSGGAAARAAKIMRNTVKGSWDNFTGSVETASIALLHRFQPALKGALEGAAKLVNTGASGAGGFIAGLTGAAATRRLEKDPQGRVTKVVDTTSGAQRAGMKLRSALAPVFAWARKELPRFASGVVKVGKQIFGAFAPAAPLLKNVVLPLLQGVAEGVIGGVVAAFKIAIPIIKIVAAALGFVGRVLAPLSGAFRWLGRAIGFVFGGPILKVLSKLPKVGAAFKLLGVPLRVASSLVRGVGRSVVWLGSAFGRALTFVSRFAGTLSGAARRVAVGATNMVGRVVRVFETLPGKVAARALRTGRAVVSGIANGVRGTLGRLVAFFGRVGKAIVDAIVNAIKSAPGAITGAITSLVPDAAKGAVNDALGLVGGGTGGLGSGTLRRAHGGPVRRGGLVLVGEHGPELAALPGGSRVVPASDTRRMAAPRFGSARPAQTMRPAAAAPLVAHLVVNLDGKRLHEGVHRVERRLQEIR